MPCRPEGAGNLRNGSGPAVAQRGARSSPLALALDPRQAARNGRGIARGRGCRGGAARDGGVPRGSRAGGSSQRARERHRDGPAGRPLRRALQTAAQAVRRRGCHRSGGRKVRPELRRRSRPRGGGDHAPGKLPGGGVLGTLRRGRGGSCRPGGRGAGRRRRPSRRGGKKRGRHAGGRSEAAQRAVSGRCDCGREEGARAGAPGHGRDGPKADRRGPRGLCRRAAKRGARAEHRVLQGRRAAPWAGAL